MGGEQTKILLLSRLAGTKLNSLVPKMLFPTEQKFENGLGMWENGDLQNLPGIQAGLYVEGSIPKALWTPSLCRRIN